nr:phosphohydrolase [Bacteroidota bacterium]
DHESIGRIIIDYLKDQFHGTLPLSQHMFTGLYHRPFFHQLISGQLDLDRLDYLSRDSFYTGVAEGVVGHDRILRMLQVVDDQLVVEEKGLYSIEKFLVARRIMYWQVYLHKTVLAAELMAKRVVQLLWQENLLARAPYIAPELNYFLSQPIDLNAFRNDLEHVLPHFQLLDDVSIEYSFKHLQNYPSRPIAFLTSHLINRNLHKIQWSDRDFEPSEIEAVTSEAQRKYGWSKEEADTLVWTGSEAIKAYTVDQDEIQILTKDGDILPFSAFLNPAVEISLNRKYFLCYPA